MTRILQRLKTGEDFGAVAREVSKGPSAADGGDLGWLRRGTIQKALEDAAFALKDGQLSGLVRAGPGLHVVKVEERRVGGREVVRGREGGDPQRGSSRSRSAALPSAVIAELRRDALIEVKLPELQQ